MKNKSLIIVLICIFSFLSIFLVGLMIILISGNTKFSNFNFGIKISNELVMDKIYEDNFDKINVESNASDIYIKYSDDSNIRVLVYGKKDKLFVKDDDKELLIKSEEKSCNFFCFGITKDKIEIYLPNDYNKTMVLNNDFGNIKVSRFLNADIKINASSGNVNIEGGNNLDINNDFGDIKIDEANKIKVNASSGDIFIGKVNQIEAQNDYGNIEINEVTDYIDIADNCGDIKIDNINLNKNSKIKNDFGNIRLGMTNEIYIDAKVDLGKIKIKNNSRKSDITLKVENNCGDITIDN